VAGRKQSPARTWPTGATDAGRSIACLNSRDRNLLGFRRDLLTAAAYGVDKFLFVYGDKPSAGGLDLGPVVGLLG
jgi:5,10-methylenetetrahydrofolate reductase